MIADGITVVVAAGNDAAPTCSISPARVSEAITVAASTIDDDDADFSNYGSCNDLFAPGVEIRSASYLSDTGSLVGERDVDGRTTCGRCRRARAAEGTVGDTGAGVGDDRRRYDRGRPSECCGDPDKLLTSTPDHPERADDHGVPDCRTAAHSW